MPDLTSSADPLAIAVIEYGLWTVGAVVLWRVQFSAATRDRRRAPAPLAPWAVTLTHFFQMAFCVIMGGWGAQAVVNSLDGKALDPALWIIVRSTAFQFGLLAGLGAAVALPQALTGPLLPQEAPPSPRCRRPFLAAVGTCLIALPVITLIGFVWKAGLQTLGIETPDQEMVDVFRDANSPATLVFLTVLAAVVAPLTEELVFRAGLFRYLRTRVPRWIAVLAPAAVFAALHANAVAFMPLFALGVLFSLAYERTGRISVTIIAHGLFNLHTILLIIAGAYA